MNVRKITELIESTLTITPTDPSGYQDWYNCDDALKFLRHTISGDVPVYISGSGLYIYSILVSKELLKADYIEDMLGWNFGPSSGWGHGVSYEGDNNRSILTIYPPMENTGSKTLENAEPVFYFRGLEGYQPLSGYLELNQRLSHVLGIHWIPSKESYCRLNDEGDLDEIVVAKKDDKHIICTVQCNALEYYMLLTNTVLVRVFDVTRCHDVIKLVETDRAEQNISNEDDELYARHILVTGKSKQAEAGVLRGFQIIRPKANLDDIISDDHEKEYATFIAYDWKHKKVGEHSCDSDQLGNYFVESDYPYGISPVFFRPEVLAKYKQDPDKYTLKQRSISCRGSWHLKTYDINEAGQVHTYLVYLGHLPFKEQMYWKSFNESPKAPISERALTTDFKGEWDTTYNPLESLKSLLHDYPLTHQNGKEVAIWSLPCEQKEQTFNKLYYVATESKKEWQDQILELAKLVIDGFQKKPIRKLAKALNCDDPQLGSLKLLAGCLREHKVDDEIVNELMSPLFELQKTRSTFTAHGGGTIPDKDLKADHRNTITGIHKAMSLLAELIKKGILNIPLSHDN